MSYTNVADKFPTSEDDWRAESGNQFYDIDEDEHPGEWSSWYYMPEDPGFFRDHYEGEGRVGNGLTSSWYRNDDQDDELDGYGLYFDGDDMLDLTISLDVNLGSQSEAGNFRLSLLEWTGEDWSELAGQDITEDGAYIRLNDIAPEPYILVVEELNGFTDLGLPTQLSYDFDIWAYSA